MGDRFPGGVISKTPPTVTPPVDGEGGSASGLWSLAEQLDLQKAGFWPQGILPRELYAWGYNGTGQVGDGTVVARSSPVQIGALTNWAQVAAGSGHTASVKTDGTLWTWGRNTNFSGSTGQLGDGTTINRSSPVQIGALTNWAQVSAGSYLTASIKTDGTLWTWGFNSSGQLGDGTVINKSSPVQIGALTNWAQVSAGGVHTAAVTTGGQLYAWGGGGNGRLGNGTTDFLSSPVQIGALTNWAQVAAGINHTASIKTDGTLWAWGQNNLGQLGDGTTANKSSPVQIGALTNWRQVSAGSGHTASVKTDGTLWTWGRNTNFSGSTGQLGDGTVINRSSPVQIGTLTNWAQVSAGSYLTASVKTDSTLWTWGNNATGQLGDGTTANKSSPVQIGALTNWRQASAGTDHTVATTRG